MTVAELREALTKYDPSTLIVVRAPGGRSYSGGRGYFAARPVAEAAIGDTVAGKTIFTEWDGQEGREPFPVLVFE